MPHDPAAGHQLWIDFTRTRSLAALEQSIAPDVLDPAAVAAHTSGSVAAGHRTGPGLPTDGRTVFTLDLLVAAFALLHNAVLVSFDAGFDAIASVSALRLNLLTRPA